MKSERSTWAVTETLKPNKAWRYSPPTVSRDGKTVWIDAMQLTWATEHQRQADARGNGRGWGR